MLIFRKKRSKERINVNAHEKQTYNQNGEDETENAWNKYGDTHTAKKHTAEERAKERQKIAEQICIFL